MSEEKVIEMTEEEAIEEVFPEEEEEEPPKVYDIKKIEAAYLEMKAMDTTKMTRIEYQKYQWLEEQLCTAGKIGQLAWDEEFEIR